MPNGKKKSNRQDSENVEVTPSSGNIFADLELPDPELELAKAKLSLKIKHLVKEKNLTQAQAAKIMGLTRSRVSDLMRGGDGFGLDHLFCCLEAF